MRKRENQKGFTIAELLIVVAIIAVLVAIAIPVFSSSLEKARNATDVANLRSAYADAVVDYMGGVAVPASTGKGTYTITDGKGTYTWNVAPKSREGDLSKTGTNAVIGGFDIKKIPTSGDNNIEIVFDTNGNLSSMRWGGESYSTAPETSGGADTTNP